MGLRAGKDCLFAGACDILTRVKNMITTSRLLNLIQGAKTFEQAVAWHETAPDPTFREDLYALMEARGLSAKDMVRLSGIERSYFYHILSGKKKPGRNVVLRFGFCLGVNLKEMNRLLQLSGASPLNPRVRRDALLIFAVSHFYGPENANELLIRGAEAPLVLAAKDE